MNDPHEDKDEIETTYDIDVNSGNYNKHVEEKPFEAKNNPDEGGFIKEDKVPEYKAPKKPFFRKTNIIVIIASIIIVLGLVYAVMDSIEPSYTQKDFTLPHECMLHVFWIKGEFDTVKMSCNGDKFYNAEMFLDIQTTIKQILEEQGIDRDVRVNP